MNLSKFAGKLAGKMVATSLRVGERVAKGTPAMAKKTGGFFAEAGRGIKEGYVESMKKSQD